MTKKTTINKIVSSKAFWIIISLLASFLLWTYIMSTEETTIEMTFSNVKVVYQGADDLRATRGLIVTGADADTVSVRLKGTRCSATSARRTCRRSSTCPASRRRAKCR